MSRSRDSSGRQVSERQLLSLVHELFEAALNPELWPHFLERLGNAFNSHAGFLFFESDSSITGGRRVSVSTGVDPALVFEYNERYAALNPFKARHPEAYAHGPDFVINSSSLCADSEVEKSEYYHGFLKPAGIFYSAGATIYRNGPSAGVFSINRSKRAGPYTHEAESLKLLGPHLAQAFRIYHALGAAAASTAALDAIPFGVIVFSLRLRPVFTNGRARRIFECRDGLRLDRDAVTAASRSENGRLQDLISAAALCASGQTLAGGDYISISQPSGQPPLQALVSPVRMPSLLDPNCPAVLMLVSGGNQEPLDSGVIARLFGLTKREAALIAILIKGDSLAEAAEELGIHYETARTHLARIFQKTGTHRQSELMKLIVGGIARAGFDIGGFQAGRGR